ncbi:MAG TPA: ATP-binding protein [Bacteroidia bacterium]|jgi:AAA15 family ATPase/GTPase|nr:ATP-binding protein [Bacteroidia bacterium]
MIIEFSVQNFRSIYDKVTLSMLASKLTGKEATLDNIFYHENYPNIPLLKSAVIYGANASGKSNVLKSLEFFKDFIIDSTDYKFAQPLPHEPFRLNRKGPTEPSYFQIDFIARDKIRYIYSFKFDENEVVEESLSSFSSRKETRLFFRKKGEKINFSSSFKGEKKVLEDQLLANNLLLSKAANSNYEQLQIVYTYFNGLNIFLEHPKGGEFSKKKSIEDDYFKKYITEFLRVADTGIDSFEIKTEKKHTGLIDFNSILKVFNFSSPLYDIEVIHYTSDDYKPKQVRWDMAEESAGTRKLFDLAGYIIEILYKGDILVFDEINKSLHPHLSKFIIDLFHNKKTNPKNAQLIFTTHDVSLLTSELFRRDQIWFTEKNNKNMTELYSLGSFDKKDVRKDVPFDKWYLSGRFGAIPILGELNMKPE